MSHFEDFHRERCERAAADFDYFREAWMGHFKELSKLVRVGYPEKAEGCLGYSEFKELEEQFEGYVKSAWEYDDKR